MKKPKLKRRRMWEKDPRCHYCRKITIWNDRIGDGPNSMLDATLEHLRSRYRSDRKNPSKPNEIRLVIACWECNHKENEREQSAISIRTRRRRSNSGRRKHPLDNASQVD